MSDDQYIVIYRPHNTLKMDTKYYGPFPDFNSAHEFFCTLPALGIYVEATEGPIGEGAKHIPKLEMPG